ncbi:MAG TPA: AsmA family protein [Bryobacteraceae bacterium]|nr:AsmA family protein [Bryobacteraceae bacterium]HPQ15870.1 AsmA family protein [Bryobacteraceae bacterium]HPU73711.1 AsmA family protein [Bryobacteraceae bacterium]
MKRWGLRILAVLGGLIILLAAAGLAARSLISDSAKDVLVSSLAETLNVPVTVGAAEFDLVEFLKLQPAVSLTEITAGNPPGFRGRHLLEAQRMNAQVRLLPLLRRRIEVRSIVFEQPRIIVESNAQGVTNIEAFVKGIGSKERPAAAPANGSQQPHELAIGEMRVDEGVIVYGGRPLVEGINLRVRDFAEGQSARIELGARLFGGNNSRVKLNGRAGPFAADALPLDATLALDIAPAEIPARLRREQFGSFLGAPGSKARAGLQGTVKGDLYGTVSGPAKLTLSDVMIGKDDKHVLPLAGEVPITFAASRLMSSPAFQLKIAKARLQLGTGEWNGEAEFRLRGTELSGSSRGSIRNVDINELAGAFTTAEGKIYGVAEIPTYSVKFSGKNADQIRDSAAGAGKLTVTKGRIAALDMLASIQRALNQSGDSAAGETPFTTLVSDLNIGQRRLDLSGVLLDSPALRLAGRGWIGFDQSLDFDLEARVTGATARLVSQVTRRPQTDEAAIPVKVTGTVNSPHVRPDVRKLATGAAESLFRSLLKGK